MVTLFYKVSLFYVILGNYLQKHLQMKEKCCIFVVEKQSI